MNKNVQRKKPTQGRNEQRQVHNFLDHLEGVVLHYHRTTTECPSGDHAPKKTNPLNQLTTKH
jgi:hypothetical protein